MPLKHLLLAALVGMACACSAQVATSAVPGESAHTGWAYSDSCRTFHRLWTTMDSVHSNQTGGLTVLYIGGSHLQGGWIGHEMRRLLAAWAPQAEMSRAMHRSTSLAEPSASIGNWLRQHSRAHGMGYMDLTNALGGPGIVAEWIEDERMQPDGMHFTAKGYSAIANALFTAWMDAYSQAQKAPFLNSAIDAQPQQ